MATAGMELATARLGGKAMTAISAPASPTALDTVYATTARVTA